MKLQVWITVWTVCLLLPGCRPAQPMSSSPSVASTNSIPDMEQDLAWLEQQIAQAQDELIEYERLHDVIRVCARAEEEKEGIQLMVSERSKRQEDLDVLEYEHPELMETNSACRAQLDAALRAQHDQLRRRIEFLEDREYKWQSRYIFASMRTSDQRHLEATLDRLEKTYEETAERLHEATMAAALKSCAKE